VNPRTPVHLAPIILSILDRELHSSNHAKRNSREIRNEESDSQNRPTTIKVEEKPKVSVDTRAKRLLSSGEERPDEAAGGGQTSPIVRHESYERSRACQKIHSYTVNKHPTPSKGRRLMIAFRNGPNARPDKGVGGRSLEGRKKKENRGEARRALSERAGAKGGREETEGNLDDGTAGETEGVRSQQQHWGR